jgi:hypothetical protein
MGSLDVPELFLASSVQNVDKGSLPFDHTLFPVQI